jgi:hypothetical protein
MFYVIDLLSEQYLDEIQSYTGSASFSDGATTAGVSVGQKKRNLL